MIRYLKAFWITLKMTLRGEKPQVRHAALRQWIAEATVLCDAAIEALPAELQTMRFKIEGRQTTPNTILGSVRHHLTEEYIYLLTHETQYSLTGIYASNVNDQYHVECLLKALEGQPVITSVGMLLECLNKIPSTNSENA